MSIGGIGSGHQAQLSQLLSTLFSRLDGASGGNASTGSTTSTATSSASDTSATSNDAVGQLSDEILALLVQLQQAGSASNSGDGASTSSADPSGQSPIQQLFSAIDTNGDGSISKSEFESYITQSGGTQQEADAIFSQLDPNGTGSVSENQLADAAKAGRPHHGHHHHHVGQSGQSELANLLFPQSDTDGDSASDSSSTSSTDNPLQPGNATVNPFAAELQPLALPADLRVSLFSSLDSNGDGSLTQAEVEQRVTQAGGTTAAADALFAQLDPDGTGSVSQDQFAQNLWPQSGRLFDWSSASASGGSAQDAIAALLQNPTTVQTA